MVTSLELGEDDKQVDVGVTPVVAASDRAEQDHLGGSEPLDQHADHLGHPRRQAPALVRRLAVANLAGDHTHRPSSPLELP